ncbi:glycosyltransferase, partial [Gammaproteobacteria bacterium]|nr:glycosyltransferase [Gammaproteobacteria bacterium]
LVVANACTDNTVAFLENYQEQAKEKDWLPLAWLEEATPGKSHALNRAIPELHSELIAFVDDDHRVDENYLIGICAAADSNPVATLFCGRILPDWDGSEPAWVHDTGPYRIYPLPVPRQEYGESERSIGHEGPIPGGGNLFLRRQLFDDIGGFSTELGPKGHNLGGGEDTDFVVRALDTKAELLYIPDVKQYHYVDPARLRLAYLLKKSFQRSRASVQTVKQHARIPLYMWRKLAEYVFHAVFSLRWSKTRFFLVRIAATLGEIRGTQG